MTATNHDALRPDQGESLLMGAIRGWDRFWFTPADPASLALMRIFCGLVVFYVNLTYSWGLFGYVGPDAWYNQEVADYVQNEVPMYGLTWGWGEVPVQISKGSWYWSIYYHVHSPGWIVAIHVLFVVSPLLFAAGLFTRVFGVLTWIGAMSYCQRALNTVYGVDTMMMIALTYLNLGPSGAMYSLDRWLQVRRSRLRGEPVPGVKPSYSANFAIRMTQIHFCIIYLATGTSKLLGPTWWSGTSLNLVLLNTAFAPMDHLSYYSFMKWLAGNRVLWEVVMTSSIVFTLAIEIALPFLIWNRRTRWFCICCSVLLHTGIGLLMGLVTFSLMMLTMLLSFVPPETARLIVANLTESVAAPRRKVAPSAKVGALVLTR